jgi:hypothetical protein
MLRNLLNQLTSKPDKYKLNLFYNELVVEIFDLKERIKKLEEESRKKFIESVWDKANEKKGEK